MVPPRNPGSESLDDAILDVAAARRRARIPATTEAAIVRMVPASPRPPRSSSGPKPATLHRGSHDILPGPGTPQEPATLYLQAPAPEVNWAELGWAIGCATGAPGDAEGTRGAVLLGTLPQPVFRQPDVTGHT